MDKPLENRPKVAVNEGGLEGSHSEETLPMHPGSKIRNSTFKIIIAMYIITLVY